MSNHGYTKREKAFINLHWGSNEPCTICLWYQCAYMYLHLHVNVQIKEQYSDC